MRQVCNDQRLTVTGALRLDDKPQRPSRPAVFLAGWPAVRFHPSPPPPPRRRRSHSREGGRFWSERCITRCIGRNTDCAAQLGDKIKSSGETDEHQSLDVKFRCVQSLCVFADLGSEECRWFLIRVNNVSVYMQIQTPHQTTIWTNESDV